jgi:tetratricopeptide (TPR) repeat protein
LTGAKAHLERAIALGDNAPEIQYMLAKVLQGLGDSAQARERLQTYQRLNDAQKDKTQAAGKAESGDQAMVAGQFAEAVSLYRDALVSDPDQPLILYKMAKALDKLKDIAGERSELLRAIQLDPNLAEAQNQLGYLAVREGDSGQAETYFRAAVKASPSYVVAWINLAATLASEARWQDAKQALDRALEIDPDNAEARQLGQAIADARPAT